MDERLLAAVLNEVFDTAEQIHSDAVNQKKEAAKKGESRIPYYLAAKNVYFNGLNTTVIWRDGTHTTVRCSDEDKNKYSRESGLMMCYMKRIAGSGSVLRELLAPAYDGRNVQRSKEEKKAYKDSKYGNKEESADA